MLSVVALIAKVGHMLCPVIFVWSWIEINNIWQGYQTFFFFLVGGRILSWNGVFRSEPEPFFSQRSAVPQSWLRTKVDRVFSVTAFILSNNLPEEIRLASSFKSLLKPYFWKRALTGFEVWNLFQLLNHFLKHIKAPVLLIIDCFNLPIHFQGPLVLIRVTGDYFNHFSFFSCLIILLILIF